LKKVISLQPKNGGQTPGKRGRVLLTSKGFMNGKGTTRKRVSLGLAICRGLPGEKKKGGREETGRALSKKKTWKIFRGPSLRRLFPWYLPKKNGNFKGQK